MLTIEEIKRGVSEAGEEYGIRNAYLFGSYARGEANEDSDVDLIVDDGGNIRTLVELSRFRLKLTEKLGREVDVLMIDGVQPKFFDLIKNDRMLVYGK